MLKTWMDRIRARHQLPEPFGPNDLLASWKTRPIRVESFEVADTPPVEPISELAELAMERNGQPFVKWWHYFDAYEREIGDRARFAREGLSVPPLRVLEIGVWRGGSLGLWREYFGREAIIFGIDIDPVSATWGVSDAEIRIGSQTDTTFLSSVVNEMGGVDIVIDDGSHLSEHVVTTLRHLWPLLSDGGIYLIEDLHTSYWPAWGGGLRRKSSSIEALKSLVDVLHQPYFGSSADQQGLGIERATLSSISFYDSVAALHKKRQPSPRPFRGGTEQ